MFGTGQEVMFQVLSAVLWIRFWGAGLYAEWLMISLLPLLVIRGNTGVFHSATSDMIRHKRLNDQEALAATFQDLKVSERLMLSLVAGIYVTATVLVAALAETEYFSTGQLWLVTGLYLFQFFVFQRQQAVLCLAKASGESLSAVTWQNHFRLAFIVMMLVPSLVAGPIVCLVAAVTAQLAVYRLTENRFQGLRPQLEAATSGDLSARRLKGSARELAIKGVLFSLIPLGHTATHTVSVWAVGFFFGPIVGAAFHNMRTIARSAVLFAKAVEMSMRLELSRLFAARDTLHSAQLFHRALFATGVASAVLMAALAMWGDELFAFLTHGELPFFPQPFWLLCLAAMLHAISQVYLGVAFSVNRHGAMTRRYFGTLGILLLVVAPSAQVGLVTLASVTLAAELAMLLTARQTANALIDEARTA